MGTQTFFAANHLIFLILPYPKNGDTYFLLHFRVRSAIILAQNFINQKNIKEMFFHQLLSPFLAERKSAWPPLF
jgi:hypothetical protein